MLQGPPHKSSNCPPPEIISMSKPLFIILVGMINQTKLGSSLQVIVFIFRIMAFGLYFNHLENFMISTFFIEFIICEIIIIFW